MSLYSDCCGAADRVIRKVLDMNYSEQGVCPNCLEHCSFSNDELIEELKQVTTGTDQISFGIRELIKDKASHVDVIDYVKKLAKDNARIMADVLGIELTEKILAV